jgi:sterol desaturase/sphingolipid hydroxylase (fatty acid hydroxylase superfamily)
MANSVKIGGKVRAFDNDFLEKMSRIHPAVPICVWGPISLGSIYLGFRDGFSVPRVASLSLAGLFVWTLVEYILHRWIFHWQPRSPRLRDRFYPVHQLHHDVQEWDRIVAPPLMAVPLVVILLGIVWLCLGQPTVFPFFGGFLIGYLVYDYTHYATHYVRPLTWIGKGLRRRHLQHHFACPDRWYGVSSPLWDYVFRTHVPRGVRPASRQ